MMTIKHLIAGAVVTAAVSTALVLTTAVGANAQVFPTPTPIGPGSVAKPIYTQPSLPGFHLPAELWTKYGPQVKPSALPKYSVLLSCGADFSPYAYAALAREGYTLTGDSTPYATDDPQLLSLLAAGNSVSCRWVQRSTGAIVDVTTAINVNDAAFVARLRATGYAEPGPVQGFHRTDADTNRTTTVDVATGQGGIDIITFDWNRTDLTYLFQDIEAQFYNANH
jgi:hypothetical protein